MGFPQSWAKVEVQSQDSPDQQLLATVNGVFVDWDWVLIGPDGQVVLPAASRPGSRAFSLRLPLTSKRTQLEFTAIDPFGKVRQETLILVYPDYVSGTLAAGALPSLGNSWNVGIGLTSLSYTQSLVNPFSEIALTPKIAFQHPLSNRWDIGASSFVNAVSLHSSQSDMKAYFLGINGRVGYSLPFVPKPWTLSLAGGLYYTTMITSGVAFGFRNMLGPQIFPTVRRSLGPKKMLGAYFKYSPVDQAGSFGFSSHETAGGLSYTRLLKNRKSISYTLDYSRISINLAETITASSLTGGVAYGF